MKEETKNSSNINTSINSDSKLNKDKNDEKKPEKRQKMGKFEKIFWFTILILFIIYLTLQFLANGHMQEENIAQSNHEPVSKEIFKTIIKEIEVIIPDDTINKNLEDTDVIDKIKNNLSDKLSELDINIDTQINQAFSIVYANIDNFLDFHYSVIGEYTELGAAATGEIGETIKNKLFGENFETYLGEAKKDINAIYQSSIKDHFSQIDNYALNGVDKELNFEILNRLSDDVSQRVSIQLDKIGILVASRVAPKIIAVISAKVIAKTGSKLATKTAAKLAAKTAATGTAAGAGTLCGPFFWVCSPVAAGIVWFGTDAVIVSGDEYFNREEFRNEIIAMIDSQKLELSEKIKESYFQDFKDQSEILIKDYKSTHIEKKVRRKVKDRL